MSFVIGKKFVLSFEEDNNELFEPIREKLRKYKGRIRKMGSDYLAYRLLGAVIDGYFAILEDLGEKLSSLEDKVVTDPNPRVLRAIHSLRIEMTSALQVRLAAQRGSGCADAGRSFRSSGREPRHISETSTTIPFRSSRPWRPTGR